MAKYEVATEPSEPQTVWFGDCTDNECFWSKSKLVYYEGRRIRAAAKRHVASKGHTVMVHSERVASIQYSPVTP